MRTIPRARLGTSEPSCSLSPSRVAGQSSSDGGQAGTIRQSWISVCPETLYQRQLSSIWPYTLYGEVVSPG